MSKIITTDVLVIGAGLAGERAAIASASKGLNVIIQIGRASCRERV